MKELLKQAFQAGRDFGHAMGTGRPTYGLTFDEWYYENENQALSLGAVSNMLCGSFDPDNSTSSATKCKCGREKWEHPKTT